MSKYKVGDRVRVRKDLTTGMFYGPTSAASGMAVFKNKVATIKKECSDNRYTIDLDNNSHWWTDEMFAGLADGGQEALKDGDAVRIKNKNLKECGKIGSIFRAYKTHALVTLDGKYATFFNYEDIESIPDDSPDDADISTVQEPEELKVGGTYIIKSDLYKSVLDQNAEKRKERFNELTGEKISEEPANKPNEEPEELKVGDYVRVTEQWSSYHREVGRVSYIPELSGSYCNVKFSDETCTALDFAHLEKIRDDEPIPYITLTERPEIVLQEDVEPDLVNHPSHYADRPVEVIDIIRATLTKEQYQGFLLGNVLKYNMRAGLKDDREQDLAKGKWYYDKYLESEETE